METLKLHTGVGMPAIGFGTWQLEGGAETVRAALEAGYRMIDTSGDYGTQPAVGQAIRECDIPRDQVFLVTKVEEDEDGLEATRDRLDDLGLDYADLVLIHRPPRHGPGSDIWEGLIQAKRQGLARDIGVSNYTTGQIEEITEATGEGPVVNQVEWSPFGYTREMLEFCRSNGIVIQAYSPLTRGQRLDDPTLQGIGVRHGKTPAQVLLRWNIQLGTPPLPKASDGEHILDNFSVFDFELSHEEMDVLNGLNERYSALAGLAYA